MARLPAQVRVADEAEVLAAILRTGGPHVPLPGGGRGVHAGGGRCGLALLDRDRVVRLHQEDVLGALLVHCGRPGAVVRRIASAASYTGAEPEPAERGRRKTLGE
ncbi:hypothetical protein QJS66_05925 [Kocuria rhizophila]|nr:hypothetical protein QJS66_05925 [Kocuria rhizophila]